MTEKQAEMIAVLLSEATRKYNYTKSEYWHGRLTAISDVLDIIDEV